MPEDLPEVLRKLKVREFAGLHKQSEDFPHFWRTEQERLRTEWEKKWHDSDSIEALRYCGRDVVDIMAGFLEDHNDERALVASDKLGDK